MNTTSFTTIEKCRICGNTELRTILDLGSMVLTGMFPKPGEYVDSCPVELVKCWSETEDECCGLVQLRHTYDLGKLYGDHYGYRSGLNASMVAHLEGIVREIEHRVTLNDNDLILDIASNDGVLLNAYKNSTLQLVGIDPSAEKFKEFYKPGIRRFSEFFSKDIIKNNFSIKAKVITSVAVFYDLEEPLTFMKEIKEILANDGIWVIEQSYLPTMIKNTSYDTLCHEHLEYYALKQINWMAQKVGLKIVDVDFNNANGGSFRVSIAQDVSNMLPKTEKINTILQQEKESGFDNWNVYQEFADNTKKHKEELIQCLKRLKTEGKKVCGYGASTKGNVILQYCNITVDDLSCIAEVNEYKFGRVTPGTNIPIYSEAEVKEMQPDYLLVLPWHFKENSIKRESTYLADGGHLIFPLPKIEIIP